MDESSSHVAPAVPDHGPAHDFYNYSQDERRQRQTSDPGFDTALFDAAVDLVLRKLGALDTRGLL